MKPLYPAPMQDPFGQPLRRLEDHRFLTGTGRYTDDHTFPGELHAHLVRSPHAHADLLGLDIQAAKAAPGVIGVPKPAGPSFQAESSKSGLNHPCSGWSTVKRQEIALC
ncbi:MAG: hypothetical protein NVSMB18_30400 [Acetobacteraceae bacterium]